MQEAFDDTYGKTICYGSNASQEARLAVSIVAVIRILSTGSPIDSSALCLFAASDSARAASKERVLQRKDKLVDHLTSKKHGLNENDAEYAATKNNAY
jgi:hypothetical protein